MKRRNRQLNLITVILAFLFCTLISGFGTKAIYRESLNTDITLNVIDSSSIAEVTFNTHGGSAVPNNPREVQVNTAIGTLPTSLKANHNFIGWYTEENGGTKVTSSTIITGNVTYHARFVPILCKKATTLHTETCSRTSEGCIMAGFSNGETINYGSLPTDNSPVTGDAYDCDVNDDGTWDSATERFYYIRGTNNETGYYVHYTNFDSNGQTTGTVDDEIEVYSTAQTFLPTTTTPASNPWSHDELVSNNGAVTRFINMDDLRAACGDPIILDTNGYLNSCYFMLEKTKFHNADEGRSGIWVELDNNQYHRIDSRTNKLSTMTSSSKNAARPVIEVPNNAIEGYVEGTEYTITLNLQGGTGVTSVTRYGGQTVGTLPTPTKDNNTFEGWYEDNTYTVEITSDRIVTHDETFVAKWTEDEDTFPIVFEQTGECVFNGSTDNITGSECEDYHDKKYIDTGIALFSQENYQKDFEVGFTIVSYTANLQEHTQSTFFDSKLENESLVYPGFVFRRNTNKLELTEKIEGVTAAQSFTYHAGDSFKIVRKNNKIYYSVNNGNLELLQDTSAFSHQFELHSWFGAYAMEEDVNSTGENSTAARYLKATLSNMYIKLGTYPSETVRVTFNAGEGGTSTLAYKDVNRDSVVGELPTASKANSIFEGWYTESSGGTKITEETIIVDNITYYAHYLPASRVTFDAGEGGTSSLAYKDVATGTTIGELPTATKDGYAFDGWYTETSGGGTKITEETIINANVTYYANYQEGYLVTFDSDGGTASFDEKLVLKNTAVGELPTATKSNYNFEGWYEDNTYAVEVTPATIISSTSTFIAKWAPSNKAAVVNGVYYNTLKLAVESVTGSEQTEVKLLKNVTEQITVTSGQNIKFNFQNNTLQYNSSNVIINEGTVEIYNGTISTTAAAGAINNNTGGVLTISGGRIISTGARQAVYNDGGTLYITGDAYLSNTGTQRAALHNHAGTVYITGGTIVATGWHAIRNEATMTIGEDDGTISTTSPVIQGVSNGILADTDFNYYDGVIRGKAGAAISNETKAILKNGTSIIHEQVSGYNEVHLEGNTKRVTFNGNGGTSSLAYKDVELGTAIGELPTATKAGEVFIGWFTDATNGTKIDETTTITADIEYFAHYKSVICMKATTLHTSGNTTYGTLPTGPLTIAGDAYDCDVNGDGTFDDATERFYYLTDDGNDNAILIYYNNIENDTPTCIANGVTYGSSSNTSGPTTAYANLPSTSSWSNVNLANSTRTITDNTGTSVTSFTYTDKAARLATTSEIESACGITVSSTPQAGELSSCNFLLENVGNTCLSSYWLETTVSGSTTKAFQIDENGMVNNSISISGIRPVIEVPLSLVEKESEIVEFDTIPTAMRNYFDNISTWSSGATDTSHASFDTAMTNNLNSNNCVYFTGDNRDTEYLSTYCDQPNKYDTEVNGNVKVYEYDLATRTRSNTEATYVTSNNGLLYNMIPNKVYYWESSSDSSVNGYVKPLGERRIISIDNATGLRKTRNVRDLGGISATYTDLNNQTVTGTIKYGKLFRGEKIWGGDGNSVQYYTKLGIQNEMDLRANSEVNASTEDHLTRITANASVNTFEIIHYGIDYGGYDVTSGNTTTHYDYYDLSRDALTRVMNEIVNNNDDYSIYFHCRIGADRTGTLAYLIEGILGVSEEDRYRDYELTVFFGLRERTRFYENKGDNYIKFIHLKQAIRDASTNNTEDVVAWYLKGSTNVNADLQLINDFRNKMIE